MNFHGQWPRGPEIKQTRSHARRYFFPTVLVLVAALWALPARGQTSPLLYAETITVTTGGPFEFTFRDEGTGATNYVAEFSADLGGENWIEDAAATITSLGDGSFRVRIADPVQPNGFYRIVAFGPAGGPVVANFAAAEFQASEGGMVSAVIHFSAPYSGTIRYTITGTAGEADYQPLSGEVEVDNSMTAVIPIILTDNSSLDELKYLVLRIEPGTGFETGAASETRVMIEENDADWSGTLSLGAAALGFILQIEESVNGVEARLRSDPAGVFPLDPAECTLVFTEDLFECASPPMALAPESNLFETPGLLRLQLAAANGIEGQLVSSTSVEGEATLIMEYPAKAYLNRTNRGTFKLYKPPVTPSSQPVELVQAQ